VECPHQNSKFKQYAAFIRVDSFKSQNTESRQFPYFTRKYYHNNSSIGENTMRKYFIALFVLTWKFILFWISAELFILFLGLKFSERWVEDSFHLVGVFAIPVCILTSLADTIGNNDVPPLLEFLYILFVVALAALFFFLGIIAVAFLSWNGAGWGLGST
jgi:hypothetical protein